MLIAVLRALRSSVVIALIALVLATLRHGALDGAMMLRLAELNRTLFAVVFAALCGWEFWYRRARRRHAAG